MEDALFDFRHGVRTGGWIELKHLNVVGENKERGIDYQPVKSSHFLAAMRSFAIPTDGVFVDFGSGKGRALLLASLYGFRRVVGVEFAEELSLHAERNLARFRARARSPFEAQVLTLDATSYPVTSEDRVFFLYNPFQESVLAQVLANIRLSVLAQPRPVHLVYANPVYRHVLDNDPFWLNTGELYVRDLEPIIHYQPRVALRAA